MQKLKLQEKTILKIIQEFFSTKRYVDVVEWIKSVPLDVIKNCHLEDLRSALLSYNITRVLDVLKRKRYASPYFSLYLILIKTIEKEKDIIQTQWYLLKNLNLNKPINLILDDTIIIYDKDDQKELEKDIFNNSAEAKQFLKSLISSDLLYSNGTLYKPIARSSMDIFQEIVKQKYLPPESKNYKKYEKVVNFISNLNFQMQRLLSENGLGIIIYNDTLYIIKRLLVFSNDGFFGVEEKKDEKIFKDPGKIIGVEIKEDLQLGKLIFFEKQKEITNLGDSEDVLPLFTLDEQLLESSSIKKEWNFENVGDCKSFIDLVLEKMEKGFQLLERHKRGSLKISEDPDTYIKISLLFSDNLESLSERINYLKHLKKINTNPSYTPQILNKLREAYIFLLREVVEEGNYKRFSALIREIKNLKIFEPSSELPSFSESEDSSYYTLKDFIGIVSYLFESSRIPGERILDDIDYITRHWELDRETISILNGPLLKALSYMIYYYLKEHKFMKAIRFLANYLEEHSAFNYSSIFSLIIDIFGELYNVNWVLHKEEGEQSSQPWEHITPSYYIEFVEDSLQLIRERFSNLEKEQQSYLQKHLESILSKLSQEISFILFMNTHLPHFLNSIINSTKTLLFPYTIHKIIHNFVRSVALIGTETYNVSLLRVFLGWIKNNYEKEELIVDYFSIIFNKLYKIPISLDNDKQPFDPKKDAFLEFLIMSNYYVKAKVSDSGLRIPLTNSIEKLFQKWYIRGNPLKITVYYHYNFVDRWIEFTRYTSLHEQIKNHLKIKDLFWNIWEGENGITYFNEHYNQLPITVKQSLRDLIFSGFSSILEKPFSSYNEFIVFNTVFTIIQEDYQIYKLSPSLMREIISQYVKYLHSSLSLIAQAAKVEEFKKIFENIKENLVFYKYSHLYSLFNKLILIYEFNPEEAKRILYRLEMIKSTTPILLTFLENYETIIKNKKQFIEITKDYLKKEEIMILLEKISKSSLNMYYPSKVWFMEVSKHEYLRKEGLEPIKELFSIVLVQAHENREELLYDMFLFVRNVFEDQEIFMDNKKELLKLILPLFQKYNAPKELIAQLESYINYVKELDNTKNLYYSLSSSGATSYGKDLSKLRKLINKIENLILTYRHFFILWHMYGTCLLLLGDLRRAIEAFETALKYKALPYSKEKTYNNLFYAYYNLGEKDKILEIYNSLDISFKQLDLLKSYIKRIKEEKKKEKR